MSQAEWNAARAKLQSGPDYVMVRRSAQAGQFAGDKKGGQDGIAINWFEINKLDLPAATGGKAYDDTVIKKDLADLQDEVDVLQDQVDAIVVPDTSSLATKKELTDAVKVLQDQIDAIKAGGGGGDGFDPTELIADIDALAEDITALESDKVEVAAGQSMLTIWRGSTSEYDAITHDPNTLYIVTP